MCIDYPFICSFLVIFNPDWGEWEGGALAVRHQHRQVQLWLWVAPEGGDQGIQPQAPQHLTRVWWRALQRSQEVRPLIQAHLQDHTTGLWADMQCEYFYGVEFLFLLLEMDSNIMQNVEWVMKLLHGSMSAKLMLYVCFMLKWENKD